MYLYLILGILYKTSCSLIFISLEYLQFFDRILDNLPLVVPIQWQDQASRPVYQLGFHVGLKGQYAGSKEEKYFMHNHLSFVVKYHNDMQSEAARIVGFEVKPFSVKHTYEGKWTEKTRLTTCDPQTKYTVTSSNTPQDVEEKQRNHLHI